MARSTKRAPRSKASVYLCFDLGGTKLKAAHITSDGKILAECSKRVDQTQGFKGLLRDFKLLADELPKASIKAIGVASAGPLHPERGVLLDPTNFFTDEQSWGIIQIVAPLKRMFKKPVVLENDAAAAVLGEQWKGGHGAVKNIVAMTLGTGVGIGVVANGELVRAGQGLHPEASHIPLIQDHSRAAHHPDHFDIRDYPCACGAYGCIEAYLAGTHFSRRLSHLKGRQLTGQASVALAKSGDKAVREAFREYGRNLAQAIRVLSVLFAPEVVVISGGFSHAADLFLPETQAALPALMERYREGVDLLPKVKVSRLQNEAGVLGAAFISIRNQR